MLRPVPQGRVAWSDPRLRPAWGVLALAAAVALLVFPRVAVVTDEAYYAGQALGLLHGSLLPTGAEALPFAPGQEATAVRYPYGWPLLLAPLRLLGFRAMFAATLALHLLGGAAVARMLVRRGLPAWLAAAWVFHPVAWVFSRTLMSDVPAAALILLSLDLWEQGRPGRSAAALGYALFTRTANLMAAAGVGLAVLLGRPRPRDVMLLVLGPILGGIAFVALNRVALGSAMGTWYGVVGMGAFTADQVPRHLLLYAGGLLLLPPFPLACLLLRPRGCDLWAVAALPTLGFFVVYSYHDQSASPLETFLGGQRLILIAHAVLLVATMRVWAAIPVLRFRRAVLATAAACAAAASLAWRWRLEERFIPAVRAVAACRPRTIAYNAYAHRIVVPVEADSFRTILLARPVPPTDLAVILPREVSRSVLASGRFALPPELRAATDRCRPVGAYLVFDLAGRCPWQPTGDCHLPPPQGSRRLPVFGE
jgi:hypothetical protein